MVVAVLAEVTVVVQAQGVTAHRNDLQAVVLHEVPIRNRGVLRHQPGVQVAATAETVLQEQLLHAAAPQHVRNRLQQIVPRRRIQRQLVNSTATRSQQGQKQVRQLKAENRSLKRKVTTANRQTSQARRQQRSTITVNNFGGYYPMTGYSMYGLQRSMMFNNLLFGIYFHDYYNHSIHHSYLWHYHHRNYDRSHWDAKKQAEYEHYKEYYENQGVEANANYVDPDTNLDEDFAATYVEENPDKFYGDNVEVVTV